MLCGECSALRNAGQFFQMFGADTNRMGRVQDVLHCNIKRALLKEYSCHMASLMKEVLNGTSVCVLWLWYNTVPCGVPPSPSP